MIVKGPVFLRSGSYADKLGGFGEYLRLVRDVPAVGTTCSLGWKDKYQRVEQGIPKEGINLV